MRNSEGCLNAAQVFSSGMVLQQGAPLPVWGTGEPGTAVYCELNIPGRAAVTAQTVTAADGQWLLTLPAQPAGGPCTMTLRGDAQCLCFTGVWIGEVWLAGGQSNMELELQNSQNGAEAVAACANPFLHFYAVPKVTASEQADRAETRWQAVLPETAAAISAVAYYAARTLAQALPGIHIGVICCYWGGTYAHCWMPCAELETFPEGRRRLAWYNARVGDKTDADFERENAAYQQKVDEWNARAAAVRTANPNVSQAVIDRECGAYPWPPPAGRTSYQHPGNLYEAMLRRVCPYAVRGFWYYQGEQDEEWAQDYRVLLTHLVRRWRADWGDTAGQLPFLLVQLPRFGGAVPGSWPVLRAAQSAVAHTEPNAALAVLMDCGEPDNIHPTDKQTPGTRLGLLSLQTVYHKPVIGVSPRAEYAVREGAQVQVHFADCGNALVLRAPGRGFEICGTDGVFYEAHAELTAPDTVCLSAPQVSEPAAVRYAWADFGPADLFGGTALPAEPFLLIPERNQNQ